MSFYAMAVYRKQETTRVKIYHKDVKHIIFFTQTTLKGSKHNSPEHTVSKKSKELDIVCKANRKSRTCQGGRSVLPFSESLLIPSTWTFSWSVFFIDAQVAQSVLCKWLSNLGNLDSSREIQLSYHPRLNHFQSSKTSTSEWHKTSHQPKTLFTLEEQVGV